KNENHRKVLLNNELFFPSPVEFTDSNDCVTKFKQSYTDKEIYDKFKLFTQQHLRQTQKPIEHLRSNLTNPETLNYVSQLLFEERQKMGVLCLTNNPLNVKMWEEYGGAHTGICYAFKVPELYFDLN